MNDIPVMTMHHKNFYFMGLAGSGMSSIARVLLRLGNEVIGWDDAPDHATQNLLQEEGARFIHWDDVQDVECLVYSTAIVPTHPIFIWAHHQGIPIYHRSDVLASLTYMLPTIAVCGSHGKTTTCSMVHHILSALNIPHVTILGGILNGQLGGDIDETPQWLVIEACESDRTFLKYKAEYVILTNISCDHLEYYNGSVDYLIECFITWFNKLQAKIILPYQHALLEPVLPAITAPYRQVGEGCPDYNVSYISKALQGIVHLTSNTQDVDFIVPAPGYFNAMNAAMAISLIDYMGVMVWNYPNILQNYVRVSRRFEYKKCAELPSGDVHWISDYGHHPHEIKAMIDTLRSLWPNLPIRMVFEPHRYTRTQAQFLQFREILSLVDTLYLLPIYAAAEDPIEGISSEALAEAIALPEHQALSPHSLQASVDPWGHSPGIVVFQGAGTVHHHGLEWLRLHYGL